MYECLIRKQWAGTSGIYESMNKNRHGELQPNILAQNHQYLLRRIPEDSSPLNALQEIL